MQTKNSIRTRDLGPVLASIASADLLCNFRGLEVVETVLVVV